MNGKKKRETVFSSSFSPTPLYVSGVFVMCMDVSLFSFIEGHTYNCLLHRTNDTKKNWRKKKKKRKRM
jgi:hypothetical protein